MKLTDAELRELLKRMDEVETNLNNPAAKSTFRALAEEVLRLRGLINEARQWRKLAFSLPKFGEDGLTLPEWLRARDRLASEEALRDAD